MKHSVLFFLGLAVLYAQNAFEVVSIRRNVSGDGQMMFQPLQPGGRFNVVNVPLRQIILRAYRLQNFQLEGLPGWAASERYDITAKAAGDVKPDQLSVLLQNLLKERFQLVTHTVQKETTSFVLVLARQDGRLGPRNSLAPPRNAPKACETSGRVAGRKGRRRSMRILGLVRLAV